MRSIALPIVALLASLSCARSDPASDEPFLLEPLPLAAKLPLSKPANDTWFWQVLDLSERGDFVALAQTPATVDVWSVQSGRKTVALRLSDGSRTYGHVALAGEPCVAVAGHMSLETGNAGKKSHLRLVSCANGEVVATIGAQDLPDGELVALVPVSSCGFVVAQYAKGDVIVDVAAKRLRPDLAKLISDALPVDSTRSWPERARWAFTGLPGNCTLYGLSLELKPKARSIVPARLFAFDLRARQAQLLKSFAYDKNVEGEMRLFPEAKIAISPSGNVVAIHFSRDGGISAPLQERPPGIADLLLTDLRSDRPETTFDVRRSPSVRDIALLSDSEMLLLTNWLDHFQASALDLRSMELRILCTGGFGSVERSGYSVYGQRSPSAIAVNTKLNLLAAVINNHVSVLRYKRNPAGTYAGGESEC